MRKVALVDLELEEIGNALNEFKALVASGARVATMSGRLIKE